MYQKTAHFYDFFNGPEDISDVMSFLEPYIRESDKVLEIGPGTGQLSFEIAKRNNIFAYEPSASMLSLLFQKIPKDSVLEGRCTLVPTMQQVPDAFFDVAIARNVLFLLNDEEKLGLFRSVVEKLNLGGRFIFNFSNSAALINEKPLSLIGQRSIGHLTYRHDSESLRLSGRERKIKWRFGVFNDKQVIETIEEEFIIYQNTISEIENLLAEAGFKDLKVIGGFTTDAATNDFENRQPVIIGKI